MLSPFLRARVIVQRASLTQIRKLIETEIIFVPWWAVAGARRGQKRSKYFFRGTWGKRRRVRGPQGLADASGEWMKKGGLEFSTLSTNLSYSATFRCGP
jgi:hypothetical protein